MTIRGGYKVEYSAVRFITSVEWFMPLHRIELRPLTDPLDKVPP